VSAILPGKTVGIFGGGQLGRMMAMAARSFGYKIHVLDPDPACPAAYVVDKVIEASWRDDWEAGNLARGCDVVTLEIEQISPESMAMASRFAPVRPGAQMLAIIQDKVEQKTWLQKMGFPVGPFRGVHSLDQLSSAVMELGGDCFIKSARGGYDGRGQARMYPEEVSDGSIRDAWLAVGETDCVVEKAVDLEQEISVMVSRSPSGEVKVFPAAGNVHENQILVWSVIPAPIPHELDRQARQIGEALADTFQLEGLLAVEMFVTKDGKLLINELAPRPHNSYHQSERACVTGQFEQAIRAVCNLPLGDVSLVQPAAIVNLLGEVWLDEQGNERQPRFDAALAVTGVRLHLYEKLKPRRGRKMGHLSAVGVTGDEAIARVREAKSRL